MEVIYMKISRLSTHGYRIEFLEVVALPHQPVRIRDETLEFGNLFSSSWISASVLSPHEYSLEDTSWIFIRWDGRSLSIRTASFGEQ